MDTNRTNSTLGLAGLPARVRYGKRDLHTELNDARVATVFSCFSITLSLSPSHSVLWIAVMNKGALFEDRIDVIAGLARDTSRIVAMFKI